MLNWAALWKKAAGKQNLDVSGPRKQQQNLWGGSLEQMQGPSSAVWRWKKPFHRQNITYERTIFNRIFQEPEETAKVFTTNIQKPVECCKYRIFKGKNNETGLGFFGQRDNFQHSSSYALISHQQKKTYCKSENARNHGEIAMCVTYQEHVETIADSVGMIKRKNMNVSKAVIPNLQHNNNAQLEHGKAENLNKKEE